MPEHGGRRPGAGRPPSVPHIEGWPACRCAQCRKARGEPGRTKKLDARGIPGPKPGGVKPGKLSIEKETDWGS